MPKVTWRASRLSAAIAMTCSFFVWPSAAADSTHSCVEAAHEGQRLRDEGKLVGARASFLQCAVAACPDVVRTTCERWSGEIDARLPTVVIGARDGQGIDLVDVRTTIDGKLASERVDGRAFAIDPGPHEFVFESKGKKPIKQFVIAREGEKVRVIAVELQQASESEKPSGGEPPRAGEEGRSVAPVIAMGALTAVGFAGFAVFGVLGQKQKSDLESTCADSKTCASSEVSSARSKLLVADISLVVGIGSAIVTGILLVPHLTSSPNAAKKSASHFGFAPLQGGAFATYELRY